MFASAGCSERSSRRCNVILRLIEEKLSLATQVVAHICVYVYIYITVNGLIRRDVKPAVCRRLKSENIRFAKGWWLICFLLKVKTIYFHLFPLQMISTWPAEWLDLWHKIWVFTEVILLQSVLQESSQASIGGDGSPYKNLHRFAQTGGLTQDESSEAKSFF